MLFANRPETNVCSAYMYAGWARTESQREQSYKTKQSYDDFAERIRKIASNKIL